MTARKVNIDELIDVLMDLRKDVEFVDITIDEGNIVRVRRHVVVPPPSENDEDTRDLNQLIA